VGLRYALSLFSALLGNDTEQKKLYETKRYRTEKSACRFSVLYLEAIPNRKSSTQRNGTKQRKLYEQKILYAARVKLEHDSPPHLPLCTQVRASGSCPCNCHIRNLQGLVAHGYCLTRNTIERSAFESAIG